jgi:hypothetical protein
MIEVVTKNEKGCGEEIAGARGPKDMALRIFLIGDKCLNLNSGGDFKAHFKPPMRKCVTPHCGYSMWWCVGSVGVHSERQE